MAFRIDNGDDLQENHDINVTPFIDVVLVLLIVFMVAAPLSTVSVAVDLPSANSESPPEPTDPIYLTLTRDLALKLGESSVARPSLADALARETGSDRERRLHLRADREVAYGKVMELMNRLRGLGYTRIALVGEDTVE